MTEEYVGFYVQDIEFRSVVVAVQMPLAMTLSQALAGYVTRPIEGSFTYCDLCCGDGKTLNALASMNKEALFYGIDFNPVHIKKAKQTAETLGLTNVKFIESSLADIKPEDYPDFDFITINGAYSWLEEPLKQKVLEFVSSRLKENGLFYVEYMALPGRVAISPLWKLIQMLVPPGNFSSSRERGKRGLYLLRLLARRGMFYLQANPPAARAAHFYLSQSKTDDYYIDHFIHNALASGFRPMFFYEMYEDIKKHGLSYIGSVDPALNDLETAVPPSQIPTFFEITELEMIETVKDFIRNTMDRRDLFSKNPEKSSDEAIAFLKKIKISPSIPVTELTRIVPVIGGHRLPLKGGIYDRFFSLLNEGKPFVTVEDFSDFSEKQIIKALIRILATEQYNVTLHPPVEPPADFKDIKPHIAHEINRILIEESFESFTASVLISPLGTTEQLSPVDIVILKCFLENRESELIDSVAEKFSAIQKPVRTSSGMKNANTLKKEEIENFVTVFMKRKLPNLFRLSILNA